MISTKPNCNNKRCNRIDTDSDITITWGDLFYHTVGKAAIEADQLQSPVHKACTYNQKE